MKTENICDLVDTINICLNHTMLQIKRSCTFILANHDTMLDRLSEAEQELVRSYADLMHSHFSNSALDSLPELYQKLNDDEHIRKPGNQQKM